MADSKYVRHVGIHTDVFKTYSKLENEHWLGPV